MVFLNCTWANVKELVNTSHAIQVWDLTQRKRWTRMIKGSKSGTFSPLTLRSV
jgi:hypothetical protein